MFTGSDGIGSFGGSRETRRAFRRVKLGRGAVGRQADILKSDIIARSNSRVKNVSSKYVEKNLLKYSFFVVVVVVFSSSSPSAFPPLHPRGGRRCSCGDAWPLLPYTLCFVFFVFFNSNFLSVRVKTSQGSCASASCRCERAAGLGGAGASRHSTAKPQVSSTAVSSFS